MHTHAHTRTRTHTVFVCVREAQTDAAACVVCPSIKREKSVVARAGRSYLSLFCVTVPLYKFRKAAVMSKAFHGVINIWQKTWPFYQKNIFTVSFSLLLMWALCHGALQAFAFISPGSIAESAAHLHVAHSLPLRSWIKTPARVKRQSI